MNQRLKILKNIFVLFESLRFFYDKIPEKGFTVDFNESTTYLEKLKYFHGFGTNCYYVADLRSLRIIETGGSLKKMTGISPKTILNRNFAYGLKVFYLSDVPDILRALLDYHKYVYNKSIQHRLSIKCSLILKMKDGKGSFFKGLFQAAPLSLDSNGHIALMFTSITDITHLNLQEDFIKVDIIDESDKEDIILINIINKINHVVLNISRSEFRVLEQLKEGKGTKEIAEALFLSEHTVSNHRKNMLKKTEAKNTAELISKARPILT